MNIPNQTFEILTRLAALNNADMIPLAQALLSHEAGTSIDANSPIGVWVHALQQETHYPWFLAQKHIVDLINTEIIQRFIAKTAGNDALFTLRDQEKTGTLGVLVDAEPFALSLSFREDDGEPAELLLIERYNGKPQVRVYEPGSEEPVQVIALAVPSANRVAQTQDA